MHRVCRRNDLSVRAKQRGENGAARPPLSPPGPPTLPHTNNSKGDDGASDEQAHHGHDAVEIAPPSGTLISGLFNEVSLIPGSWLDGAEPVRAVAGLGRLELGIGRQRKERGDHPRWKQPSQTTGFGTMRVKTRGRSYPKAR